LYDAKRNRVVVRRDVVFDETNFDSKQHVERSVDVTVTPVESVGDGSVLPDESRRTVSPGIQPPAGTASSTTPTTPRSTTPTVRRSQREVRKPDRFGEWYEDESVDIAEHAGISRHCLYFHNVYEPRTIDEALRSTEAVEWKQAADEEMKAHQTMNTWKLTELPEGRKAVGCKWVFKVKSKPDGTVERFKARLVAKGYSQQPGTDFDETFAPVVRMNTLCSLLAYAVRHKLLIHEMDIITAFLHGNLQEEVFMEQPPGYVTEGQENLVCLLQRSLYGLKQSSRCWNDTLCDYMRKLNFRPLKSDCCIFKRDNPLSFVALYVDDLIPIAGTVEVMNTRKADIAKRFPAKDLGRLHYVLGISCVQDDENARIGLTQEVYIDKLINKFGLTDALPVTTPSDVNVVLMKDDNVSKPVDQWYYQSLVGSLLYIAVGTRPDIQFAVLAVAKYSANPNQSHLTAVKRILRYLKQTKNLVLWYNHCDYMLTGYSDADFARDIDDRHSTSGLIRICVHFQ